MNDALQERRAKPVITWMWGEWWCGARGWFGHGKTIKEAWGLYADLVP